MVVVVAVVVLVGVVELGSVWMLSRRGSDVSLDGQVV